MHSRRAFLGRCGAGAAVWTALANGDWSCLSAAAAEFDVGQLGELAAFAIERATLCRGHVCRYPHQPLSKPARRLSRAV